MVGACRRVRSTIIGLCFRTLINSFIILGGLYSPGQLKKARIPLMRGGQLSGRVSLSLQPWLIGDVGWLEKMIG